MRLTIDEYSKKYKMSKEMIKSRLKAKKINYILENGQTYIITKEEHKEITRKDVSLPQRSKTTVATVLSLYQRENQQLKEKIIQLEEKIDKLIDDKEQMLRDERDKIESLYTLKDEQLKNILELINTKLTMENEYKNTVYEVEALKSKSDKNEITTPSKLVELREYLKSLDLKSSQRKSIKKRFLDVYDSDIRIIQQNGKLFLDLIKYDYSDLLAL